MDVKQQIEKLRADLHRHNYNYYVLNAPEISDIIFSDMDACINSVSVSDGAIKVWGKARFNCLYEAKHDDMTEYISMEQ